MFTTLKPQLDLSRMQCHLTTPLLHKTPVCSINSINPQQFPKRPKPLTHYDHASQPDKAAMQMLFSSVLGLVVVEVVVSDETNADKYLCGTALQKGLATFLVFIRLALGALSIFNFAVFVYHLPLRFKGLRKEKHVVINWSQELAGVRVMSQSVDTVVFLVFPMSLWSYVLWDAILTPGSAGFAISQTGTCRKKIAEKQEIGFRF